MSTAPSLKDEAHRILPIVRSSFASILDCIPGHPRRPRELTRALNISQTLAWRISQVVGGADHVAIVQHVPGEAAVETFFDAARMCGAPEGVLQRARTAVDELKRLINDHAGDRASLEIMLAGLEQGGASGGEVANRKASFRGASQTWGVQARSRLEACILYPGSRDDTVHMVSLTGYHRLRRLIAEASWMLGRTFVATDGGAVHHQVEFAPVAPRDVLPSGFPLLRQFCSLPLPEVKRRSLPNSTVDDVLAPGPVGAQAAMTFYSGEVARDLPIRYRQPGNEFAQFAACVRTPLELLIHDVLVHRDLFGPLAPDVHLYSMLWGSPWELDRNEAPIHRMACAERVEYLGSGIASVQTKDVPRYEEMLGFVCDQLGWDAARLDVYRVTVAYPMISTATMFEFPLPAAPDQT